MGARASGSAVISFSLITVPVKLYITASSESFSFNQITTDGNRVKQKLFDAVTDQEVQDRATLRKGYEYTKDQYVILNDEELKALEGEKSNTIDIVEFVEDNNFNPLAVEKCYYLAPDKGAERPYRLLSRTLAHMKKIAVGKYYTRGKDHLIALKPGGAPNGDQLTLFQMYYANEIRAFEYQFSDAYAPSDKEIDLAKMLIKKFATNKFDIGKYNDQYSERIRDLIERKRSGETFSAPKQMVSQPVMDLAKLLEASLAGLTEKAEAKSTLPAPPDSEESK